MHIDLRMVLLQNPKYCSNPIDYAPNMMAAILGRLAREVSALPADQAGDDVDRGLVLFRMMREEGMHIQLVDTDTSNVELTGLRASCEGPVE